jgi:hypothetical protein
VHHQRDQRDDHEHQCRQLVDEDAEVQIEGPLPDRPVVQNLVTDPRRPDNAQHGEQRTDRQPERASHRGDANQRAALGEPSASDERDQER